MDKQSVVDLLVDTCKDLSLDLDKAVLGGGGAMVVMGMRKTTEDLNLWVKKDDFERLTEQYGLFGDTPDKRVIKISDNVFIREHNPNYKPVAYGFEALKVYCFSVVDMLVEKTKSLHELLRPKEKRDLDLQDVQLLQAALRAKNKVKS